MKRGCRPSSDEADYMLALNLRQSLLVRMLAVERNNCSHFQHGVSPVGFPTHIANNNREPSFKRVTSSYATLTRRHQLIATWAKCHAGRTRFEARKWRCLMAYDEWMVRSMLSGKSAGRRPFRPLTNRSCTRSNSSVDAR